ncbi:MAG TPA: signal peptidase I [Acholeplasmataceae bacterium]|nr:signal peptidase I [Acholeplasmataceae bacterium]
MNSEKKKSQIKLIIIFSLLLINIVFKLVNIFNFLLVNIVAFIIISTIFITLVICFYVIKKEMIHKYVRIIIEYFAVFIYALFFIQLVFNFVAFPAVVNQTSMNPTLFEGNRIIVLNGNKDIKRFDIVVFRIDSKKQTSMNDELDNQLWVKRVIGMPGEHISYQNGKLYVNGKLINEPHLYDDDGNLFNGYYQDKNGNIKYYNSFTDDFIIEDVLEVTKNLSSDDVRAGVIPDDYYLLLGDNRATSWDSRKIGLVHKSQIIGEGRYIINDIFNWKKIGD